MSLSTQMAGLRPAGPTKRVSIGKRALVTAVAVSLVVPVFILDTITGLEPDLSGLYLVPVVIAAYWLGMWPALGAAATVLIAELVAHPHQPVETALVHALTHAITYSMAAIVTARLREQLQRVRELEQMRDYDLELARVIQESSNESYRPRADGERFDVATRTVPARELGGDLLLVRPMGDGLITCIADISGKGVSAALFAALLQDALNTALQRTNDPEEIVTALNRHLDASLPSEMFITFFCGLITGDTLRFVNAGHDPGLLRRPGKAAAIVLDSVSGMPLGVARELRITAREVPFEPEDMLLLFTDGLTDSEGFGRSLERVVRFFEGGYWTSADELADALLAEASRVGSAQPDDITIIAVRALA